MFIADAAERAGVNPQTLRYYERRGLLHPSGRRPSGYREYTPDDVRVVRFVKRAQDLGFSLKEIEDLLALRTARPGRRAAARRLAERHREDLAQRIRDMERMHRALGHLIASCHAGADPHCPIIEALESDGEETGDDR